MLLDQQQRLLDNSIDFADAATMSRGSQGFNFHTNTTAPEAPVTNTISP